MSASSTASIAQRSTAASWSGCSHRRRGNRREVARDRAAGVRRAVADGKWIGCRASWGYEVGADGKLVVVEQLREYVRGVFLRRAAGASRGSLCEWLEATLPPHS